MQPKKVSTLDKSSWISILEHKFLIDHFRTIISSILPGAALVPECESPKLFIDIINKDPNSLEEFLSLPIVQEKIIALEKDAAVLKSDMTEMTIK